jgi:thiamine kinase-like enzyme
MEQWGAWRGEAAAIMAKQTSAPEALIGALPIWDGPIELAPLSGGITNKNFVVRDRGRRTVVRFGGDIPVHGVLRFNEQAASRAAGAAGVSPQVVYAAPSVMVLEFVEGHTLSAEDVRADRDRCVALAKRAHREIPEHLRGPSLAFNVFHILRDYGHTLTEDRSPHAPALPRLLAVARVLECAVGAIDLVFGHNDLLAANFIDDGARLWLVDWDYAGWNTPLFDLGGLSSNNGFGPAEDDAMLEAYFEAPATDELRRRFRAMLCASLLRETMWSMVSETRSTIDFDYGAYTRDNLARFEAAWAAFRETQSS